MQLPSACSNLQESFQNASVACCASCLDRLILRVWPGLCHHDGGGKWDCWFHRRQWPGYQGPTERPKGYCRRLRRQRVLHGRGQRSYPEDLERRDHDGGGKWIV